MPSEGLTSYMDRQTDQDRAAEICNEVIPPIVNSLIWSDTTETICPWCDTAPKVIQHRTGHPDATVFKCPNCQRLFRSGGFETREHFYTNLQDAIRGRWYALEDGQSIIESVMTGDLATVKKLAQKWAGPLEVVQRRRHNHRRGQSCWCEFGEDEFKVLHLYPQPHLSN